MGRGGSANLLLEGLIRSNFPVLIQQRNFFYWEKLGLTARTARTVLAIHSWKVQTGGDDKSNVCVCVYMLFSFLPHPGASMDQVSL